MADLDVELVAVSVKGPRNKRVVKVVADSLDTDEGLDVDRIAAVSTAISEVTDEVVPGSYTLEVSSPGVDRPLTTPRHFRRNLDRKVEVRHARGDTDTQTTGTIAEVTDTDVTLDTAKGAGHDPARGDLRRQDRAAMVTRPRPALLDRAREACDPSPRAAARAISPSFAQEEML